MSGGSVTPNTATAAVPRYSPADLAAAIGLPAPTDEQAAVISAPLGPFVVIAGAGSGKTETMVSRVLWLVANGAVQVDKVLGLTFTVKAAAELADRMRRRLGQLADGVGLQLDPALEPTVSTYDSYAARLADEHGLRLGSEPGARLLTDAARWQLANRIVSAYDGAMDAITVREDAVTSQVLGLADELAEQLIDPDRLRDWTARFLAGCAALPPSRRQASYRGTEVAVTTARARDQLLSLVQRFQEAKRDTRGMDFGDRMSLAARVAGATPVVGALERARYHLVLLDEYQDTSHAQLVLLRSLFGHGHPVTAVGDPFQSIYGWRGASSGAISRFPASFRSGYGTPGGVLPLSRSFRHERVILDVANAIAESLRHTETAVKRLTAGPAAAAGAVEVALLPTMPDETDWVADRIAQIWHGTRPEDGIAVLTRRRSDFPRFESALRARGIPVEVIGLGGLLTQPEVREVVSVLQVLSDPSAGAALLRLLTGPRWRIGPRDLRALHRRSGALTQAQTARAAADGPHPGVPPRSADTDPVGIIEALESLGNPADYSREGYRRLDTLRRELAGLRRRVSAPLPELLAEVEHTIGVEVELVAAGGRRTQLDRFADIVAEFTDQSESPTLSGLLAYLRVAEVVERGLGQAADSDESDGDDPIERDVRASPDRVQILTVHAAKGLEWGVVAIPSLADRVFPSSGVRQNWSRSPATVPYSLREDGAQFPDLDPAGCADVGEFDQRRKAFDGELKTLAAREERRLAYVAVTRAKRRLIASSHIWAPGLAKARTPSPFLTEIRDVTGASTAAWADPPPADEQNPLAEIDDSARWPLDPLGRRRGSSDAGADLVRAALGSPPAPDERDDELAGQSARWSADIDVLLAERDAAPADVSEVVLPSELSVSTLVSLRSDPAALAARIRRPMPRPPVPLARRGTAFHAWLELRYAPQRTLDVDEWSGAADSDAASEEDLEVLQAAFERSCWAARTPVAVEVGFVTELAGHEIRGRIDAVFAEPDGRVRVIDWKTGTQPTGRAAEAAAVQLAVYRLAYARLADLPVERVVAAFHYVRSGVTYAPSDLLDEAGLQALITAVPDRQPG